MYTCPCCGHETFESPPGSFDICPICFWEDDALQLRDPFSAGGANHVSLAQAQVGYVQFGACRRDMVAHVRSARADEAVDPRWFPLWERRIEIADIEDRDPDRHSPRAICYWSGSTPQG